MTALPFPRPAMPGSGDSVTPSPSTSITLTAAQMATALGITDTATADRLYGVAADQVQQYAPRAPGVRKDEAILRYAGYLWQSGDPHGSGALRGETFGPKSMEFVTNHAPAFRNSGAASLLTGYKRRRAGKV